MRVDFPSLVATCLTLASCTVFNGKSVPVDAGEPPISDASRDTDTGVEASTTPCGCTGVTQHVLCEGFEGVLGPNWTAFGVLPDARNTAHPHCGNQSLYLSTPQLNAGETFNTGIVETTVLRDPRLATDVFARAWVYVASSSNIATGNRFGFLEIQQRVTPFFGASVEMGASTMSLANWTTTPNGFFEAPSVFARDAWTCVEWHVQFDGVSGVSEFWVGSTSSPLLRLAPTNTRPSPAYDGFVLALFSSASVPQAPFSAWIDDVAVDAERIPCP